MSRGQTGGSGSRRGRTLIATGASAVIVGAVCWAGIAGASAATNAAGAPGTTATAETTATASPTADGSSAPSVAPADAGEQAVVDACRLLFESDAQVEDRESFAPVEAEAAGAAEADGRWTSFRDDVTLYADLFIEFKDRGWRAPDVELTLAQDRITATCAAQGVSVGDR